MDRIATLENHLDQSEFQRHFACLGIDRDRPHYFLASFPGSGNGWLRMVCADVLLRAHGVALERPQVEVMRDGTTRFQAIRDGESIYDIRTALPNLYDRQGETGRGIKSVPAPYTVIKTHHVVSCATSRAIFLFREPVSCVISAYNLLSRDQSDDDATRHSNIRVVANHYRKYLQHFINERQHHPDRCLFLSHERLLGEPLDELRRLFRFLHHPVRGTHLAAALVDFPFEHRYRHLRPESDEPTQEIDAIAGAEYRIALTL